MDLIITEISLTWRFVDKGRAMRKAWMGPGLVLAGAVVASGCAQQKLTAGDDLGNAGNKAALAMKQATVLSDDQITELHNTMILHNGVVDASAGVKADTSTIAMIDDLEKTIAAQNKFLDSLAATYTALAALSSNNTTGQFNTAFGGLVTDTNKLMKALDKTSPGLPSTATGVVEQVGGLIVSWAQAQQVVEASRKIRIPLQGAIEIMARQQKVYDANVDIFVRETGKGLGDLYRAHMLSCAPVVDGMAAVTGQKSVPNVEQLINANKAMTAGMQPLCDPKYLMPAIQTRMTQGYQKSLEALEALLPLHDQLESGNTPLDMTSLMNIIDQIQSLLKLVKPTT